MCKRTIVLAFASLLLANSAQAEPKDVKTTKGKAVGLVNLISTLSNCTEGGVFLPKLPKEPEHGSIQMVVGNVAVPATGQCAARNIKCIILAYVPKPDFVGTEDVQIEVGDGNRTTSVSYHVIVQEAPSPDNKL